MNAQITPVLFNMARLKELLREASCRLVCIYQPDGGKQYELRTAQNERIGTVSDVHAKMLLGRYVICERAASDPGQGESYFVWNPDQGE